MNSEALSLRPYARLLTMLGDQLIKNERIALIELIKNAYDADAVRVEVRFEDFNGNMIQNEHSRIVVRDDGVGMTLDTIRSQWMNPAAPQKYLAKRKGHRKTRVKKRIIQGEKGIGRFAVLKLGRLVTVTTRPPDAELETVLAYDFSRFDDDFVSKDGEEKEIFLDEIRIDCSQSRPVKFPGLEHGTLIEIRDLKGVWDDDIIKQLCRDASNLTDPVSRLTDSEVPDRFEIAVVCNGKAQAVETEEAEKLKALIEDRAVLTIRGGFRSRENVFSFEINDDKHEISMTDARITGLWIWRKRFDKARRGVASTQMAIPFSSQPESGVRYVCGDFSFHFYVFDFSRHIDGRHALIQDQKDQLKRHRIYLYRDGVRVYPYGDPDDDWLSIDVTRGTGRAGNFFSNDQVIGWIDITQEANPNLRDKTNREGLIETGGAARDLIFLVQTFLSYIKEHPYARYQQKQRERSAPRFVRDGVVAQGLAELKSGLEKSGQKPRAREVSRIEANYGREKAYLSQRAEMTEDLAGVGLSVEMASHDIMLLMNRAQEISKRLARMTREAGMDDVREQADMLVGVLQQIVDGMRDVQSLFKSSRRRRKVLKVEPVLDKIFHIYQGMLEQRTIRYRRTIVGRSPLVANTTDGVVMQVLINLFDNAAYWLGAVDPAEREIRVIVDGDRSELIFSDSGPGVDPEDLPYIFEPFYSGKGEEGRGLGLYIARQLLERHDYRIAFAEDHQKVLPGANFVVSFVKEEI